MTFFYPLKFLGKKRKIETARSRVFTASKNIRVLWKFIFKNLFEIDEITHKIIKNIFQKKFTKLEFYPFSSQGLNFP
jgi:hypothetical protein